MPTITTGATRNPIAIACRKFRPTVWPKSLNPPKKSPNFQAPALQLRQRDDGTAAFNGGSSR